MFWTYSLLVLPMPGLFDQFQPSLFRVCRVVLLQDPEELKTLIWLQTGREPLARRVEFDMKHIDKNSDGACAVGWCRLLCRCSHAVSAGPVFTSAVVCSPLCLLHPVLPVSSRERIAAGVAELHPAVRHR